jgi:ABC-2 type transport system permease protein
MNAAAQSLSDSPRPAAAVHVPAARRFGWLLRREFWEHKGGFLWAPLVAGAVSLLLSAMGIVIAMVAARDSIPEDVDISLDTGTRIQLNGMDLGMLTSQLGHQDLARLGDGIDVTLMLASGWPFVVLAFVMFFYCLGALYDERKDRSVLFWKSLPLSDSSTVLSKVASAVLVAPLIATIASILTMFGFLLLISLIVLFYGGNPVQLLWGPASPALISLQYIAAIPVYALWAMPTIGWLMLCSSWARSKPFLWAIMIPLFAGIFVAWLQFLGVFEDAAWPFFRNIVLRALTSIFPMTFMDLEYLQNVDFDVPGAARNLMNPVGVYRNLASLQLWGGVAAGAAMIFAAIRLRRWRDEG